MHELTTDERGLAKITWGLSAIAGAHPASFMIREDQPHKPTNDRLIYAPDLHLFCASMSVGHAVLTEFVDPLDPPVDVVHRLREGPGTQRYYAFATIGRVSPV